MIIGAHVSTAGGVANAPLTAGLWGIAAFQIFTRNQNRWVSKPISELEIEAFKNNCRTHGIQYTVAHNSYLINLCAPDPDNRAKSRTAMADEILRAEQLGLDGLVMHPGSHLGGGVDAALKTIAGELQQIIDQTPDGRVRILFEGTAGQGTNVGWRFEHLRDLIDLTTRTDRTGICLDTCHLFAAGYDFSTTNGYRSMMDEFDRVVGRDQLFCIHINDSKRELGSRIDRHEHIGAGTIGREPFGFFLNDPNLAEIPAILETPGEDEDYLRNLAILRSLII